MANIDNVSFSSLERSGAIQPYQANPIRRAFEKLETTPRSSKAQEAAKLGIAFGQGVRATGEASIVGMLLGGVHGAMPGGLDVKLPFMKTKTTVPADFVGAIAGLVIGTATANHESGVSGTVLNAGATCAGVFAFRSTNDAIVKLRQAKSGVTPGGGAAPIPGKISKAEFAGDFGAVRQGWGSGFLTRGQGSDIGEDPIVAAARNL